MEGFSTEIVFLVVASKFGFLDSLPPSQGKGAGRQVLGMVKKIGK